MVKRERLWQHIFIIIVINYRDYSTVHLVIMMHHSE
jgi:hypothetical protein